MSALEVAQTAAAAYEALREKQGVVHGDEAAALADQQHAALRGLIAELRLYHEHAGLTFPAPLPRGITDEMVEAGYRAAQERILLGSRQMIRAALEAAEAAR